MSLTKVDKQVLSDIEREITRLFYNLREPIVQNKYVGLSDSDKLLSMYADLEKLAKKMGVVLPR